MKNTFAPSSLLSLKNPHHHKTVVKICILFLLSLFTLLQFFCVDYRYFGAQIAFLWPRFNLLLLVAQVLCLLVLIRSAIFRVLYDRRVPWILFIAVPLCLANAYLFQLQANIAFYTDANYFFEYRLVDNGRIYSLVEERNWLGCNHMSLSRDKPFAYMCGFYNVYDCDLLEFICNKVALTSIAPVLTEYGTIAVPAQGEPYGYGKPRPYPVLRAVGDSIQVVSDVSELGEYFPQGAPIYTFTPVHLPNASLIIVFLLLGMTGYAVKLGWNIEQS